MEFKDLNLNKQLLTAISEAGYTEPTEIQLKAIPQILAGHDVIGIAQTGTGKTAAYLLPILMKVKYAQGQHPRALIVAPTRELCMQINDELGKLATHTDIRSVAAYGGIGPKTQIEDIQKGIDILVATPGRLVDIYLKGELVLKELKILVLDEADKMMDMGFMPQIRKILEIIPRKRQNILLSATMPDKVQVLTEEFLEFPVKIEVAPQSSTIETVNQIAYHVPNFKTKVNLLGHLLKDKERFLRTIVFVKTKESAENIYKFIHRKIDENVKVIHANKGQNTRINSMEAFKEGNVRILVATDVASRGIDVTMVSHVINFDVPIIYEDYVHRIGRTGRAKNSGEAITFVTEPDKLHIERIEGMIRKSIPVIPMPADVYIEETSFEEKQDLAMQLDMVKRKQDPTFQGAFHEKKKVYSFPDRKNSRKGGSKPGTSKSGAKARPGSSAKSKSAAKKSAGPKKKGKKWD